MNDTSTIHEFVMSVDTKPAKQVSIPFLLQLGQFQPGIKLDPRMLFKNGVIPMPGDEVTMRCYEFREQDDRLTWAVTWEVKGSEPYVLPEGESDLA